MKYLYGNKHWELNKEYNLDKLLYLMIDRPDEINYYDNNNHNNDFIWRNNKKQYHRDYDLPSFVYPSFVYVYKYKNKYDLHWEKNSRNHRENDKPAFVRFDGVREYYINDKFIRTETIK